MSLLVGGRGGRKWLCCKPDTARPACDGAYLSSASLSSSQSSSSSSFAVTVQQSPSSASTARSAGNQLRAAMYASDLFIKTDNTARRLTNPAGVQVLLLLTRHHCQAGGATVRYHERKNLYVARDTTIHPRHCHAPQRKQSLLPIACIHYTMTKQKYYSTLR